MLRSAADPPQQVRTALSPTSRRRGVRLQLLAQRRREQLACSVDELGGLVPDRPDVAVAGGDDAEAAAVGHRAHEQEAQVHRHDDPLEAARVEGPVSGLCQAGAPRDDGADLLALPQIERARPGDQQPVGRHGDGIGHPGGLVHEVAEEPVEVAGLLGERHQRSSGPFGSRPLSDKLRCTPAARVVRKRWISAASASDAAPSPACDSPVAAWWAGPNDPGAPGCWAPRTRRMRPLAVTAGTAGPAGVASPGVSGALPPSPTGAADGGDQAAAAGESVASGGGRGGTGAVVIVGAAGCCGAAPPFATGEAGGRGDGGGGAGGVQTGGTVPPATSAVWAATGSGAGANEGAGSPGPATAVGGRSTMAAIPTTSDPWRRTAMPLRAASAAATK